MTDDRELARSAREVNFANPETWVPIDATLAEVLRRSNGKLVSRVFQNFAGNDIRLYAPRWARDAAQHAWRRRGAIIKLIRRAHKDCNVRDALLAALDGGGDLIVQLAVMQARKE